MAIATATTGRTATPASTATTPIAAAAAATTTGSPEDRPGAIHRA